MCRATNHAHSFLFVKSASHNEQQDSSELLTKDRWLAGQSMLVNAVLVRE